MITNTYESILKQNRLSDTRTRRQLFEILQSLSEPSPITTLVELARQKMDKSSVYRTVEAFETAGIIKKVYLGWKESVELSDLFRKHHHHMTCTNCGETISFEEPTSLISEFDKITQKHNFTPTNHSIEFTGLCTKCC